MDTRAEIYHRGEGFNGVQDGIVVTRWHTPRPKMARQYVKQVSVAPADFKCHANSLPNILRALNERVFNVEGPGGLVPTPLPAPGAWVRMSDVGRRLALKVREIAPHVQRLTCDEFVMQCPAHKRSLYAQAATEYRHRGWATRDAKLGSFVKFEKIKFEASGKKSDPCPRLIQPRSVVYNVALGRYTRRIEKEMYMAISAVWDVDAGEEVVMKGLDVEQTADQLWRKWCKYEQPVAVGLDASRFDQHVSVDALKFEHKVYKDVFKGSIGANELARLLNCQLKNRGRAFVDGYRVDYEVDGCRCSGDMNTSLGNCVIMSALVLQYCKERKVAASLANNGDDCLVFMDRRSLDKFQSGLSEWFLQLGFEMKVEDPAFVFEQCEFCQMRPVWNGDRWVCVRNPLNAMAKDVMALNCRNDRDYQAWLGAVGEGGLALYGDMPLYRVLYQRMRVFGRKSGIHRAAEWYNTGFSKLVVRRRTGGSSVVADECRVSFAKAFGIPPQRQLDTESELEVADFRVGGNVGVGTSLSCVF